VLVVTGADQLAEVRRQLSELPAGAIVAEPRRRDTAPCIGLAAALLRRNDADATMLVLPADHVIDPNEEFHRTVQLAESLVREDHRRLVTLGIKPDRPATGYGYIQRGERPARTEPRPVFTVQRFREKPNREVAEQYLASGQYYWNSGVFVWSAATILSEIRDTRPALFQALERIAQAWDGPEAERVFADEYERMDPISIDYAVLERSSNVAVIEAAFQWDDVGSWGAVERVRGTPPGENTVQGLHCGLDTKATIVLTDREHLVATIGVENLIVVQCGQATLVADRSREESVKQLVELLRQRGFEKFL
jgi:mannose-1-phosphate guanylyltransferase